VPISLAKAEHNAPMHSIRAMPVPTAAEFEALAATFDAYRNHYGQPVEPRLTRAWLADQLQNGSLNVFVAEQDDSLVGFATSVRIPASLRLGHWWQIRDLYVLPAYRRQGIARALLNAVRSAAETTGALRLGIQTEENNEAALALYGGVGYVPIAGYLTLTLSLPVG